MQVWYKEIQTKNHIQTKVNKNFENKSYKGEEKNDRVRNQKTNL